MSEELKAAVAEAQEWERRGDRGGAIAALRRAVAIAPDLAPAHARLGILLQESGAAQEAVAHFAKAAQLRPQDARAWNNLSAALNQLARHADAERAAREALAIDPQHAWAQYNLGRALIALGRIDAARTALEQAVERDPANALAWDLLGSAWSEDVHLERARVAFEKSLEADPARASTWSRLASANLHLGRNDAAVEAMARAEALAPPDAAQIGSTRLVAIHYEGTRSRDEIFEEHRAWARRHAPDSEAPQFANDRAPDRRLRIAYVSPRFHRSALAQLLEPVLAAHDAGAVEVFCYASQTLDDDVTRRMRSHAARWIDATATSDAALAQRLRDDAIDVAIDLAGHTPGNRLLAFAHRPAPVTVTWLDYFDTTGLGSMDYLLTDALHSPEGDAQRFTEEPIRLPRIRFCFTPPESAPPIMSKARQDAGPVFGSFNRMAKISARTLDAWAAALARIPAARLIVKNSSLEQPEERALFAKRFAQRGIDPARVEWRGFSPHAQMLAEYGHIDVVLDTFPYNGGITTMEALWMGRPVATIRGDTLLSRQSAALLEAAGLPEGIAESAEDFAAIVEKLVDARRPDEIRESLSGSPLMDGPGLARALEEAYRALWRRWGQQ